MYKSKIGVLGVSEHFINRIVPAIKRSHSVEIYAIASRSRDKAVEISKTFNIPKAYGSYEDLMNDKEVEIVYIPLPNNLHAEWIKKCADAGKHILCEKPLAMNAGEAEDAADHAAKKGMKIAEAFMYKFHPQWNECLKMINDGKIGKLQVVHTFFGYYNDNSLNIRNIRESGGGANYDIGCYAVSTARLLFGMEPVRVLGIKEDDPEFKTDILTSGILDFGKGSRALFTVATKTCPFQKVEIHGTEGVIRIELPFNPEPEKSSEIHLFSKKESKKIIINPSNQYRILFEEFARSVVEKKDFAVQPQDSVNNMKVIDAVFRSAYSGNWEKL